jgi:hypothetical protein
LSAAVLYLSTALGVETCCNCGITFGMPESIQKRRRDDHATFYCPSGHPQSYRGETEAQKLQKALDAKTRELEQEKRSTQWARDGEKRADERAALSDRKAAAARGLVTKIKNRVGNGVCPCCNRTFDNLQRHMGTQHPDFKNEGAT